VAELIQIAWNEGETGNQDIHVIAGRPSRALNELLALYLDDGTGMLANSPHLPSHAVVRFEPIFAFTAANSGIVVDPATGVVATTHPLPVGATFIPNFIVWANVAHTSPLAASPLQIPIRVHVHQPDATGVGVARAYVTPTKMTVRQVAPSPVARFSLIAEFHDGTIGDITGVPGITWNFAGGAPAHMRFVGTSGVIEVTGPGPDHAVRATLPPALDGIVSFDGTVTVGAPWSTPIGAELVAGGAGVGRLNEVPNVLFVAEGFKAGEQPAFRALVLDLVDNLRKAKTTFPFDLLAASMNYWYVFVESPEHASSPLNALFRVQSNPLGDIMRAVQVPERPPSVPLPPAKFVSTLAHLLHQVGLPLPADGLPGVTFATKKPAWDAFYGPAHTDGVDQAMFAQWKRLAGYTLAAEQDSALGTCSGRRPQVRYADDGRSFGFNTRRVNRAQIDDMLNNLTDAATNQQVGHVWTDPAKDRALIFFLCAGARDGAASGDDGVVTSLVDKIETQLVRAAGFQIGFPVAYPIPATASRTLRARVAHEAAHSLHVGDEYGGPYRSTDTTIVERTVKHWNIQLEFTAITAGVLDGDLMRWNWPRMAKVALLVREPEVLPGGRFRIVVEQAPALAIGDALRLRTRPLSNYNGLGPMVRIVDGQNSVDGQVLGVDVIAGVLDPIAYPPGSLLYVPTLHPTTGAELMLCDERVRNSFRQTGYPMNRGTGSACGPDARDLQPVVSPPAGLPAGKPPYRSWLIGYYDGGGEAHCGVFHPAGACVMRQLKIAPSSPVRPNIVYRFCAVCRYILIDVVNPRFHPQVDREYSKFYPI
jgi:hypothetical protein